MKKYILEELIAGDLLYMISPCLREDLIVDDYIDMKDQVKYMLGETNKYIGRMIVEKFFQEGYITDQVYEKYMVGLDGFIQKE